MFNGVASKCMMFSRLVRGYRIDGRVLGPLVQVHIKERQIGIPLRFPPRKRSPATSNSNKNLKADSQRRPAKINVVVRETPQSNLKCVSDLVKDFLGTQLGLCRVLCFESAHSSIILR